MPWCFQYSHPTQDTLSAADAVTSAALSLCGSPAFGLILEVLAQLGARRERVADERTEGEAAAVALAGGADG